jgi:hypothetical protein
MPEASEQTSQVKVLNLNWTAGEDGEDGRFEVMIVTADGERHTVAPSPAAVTAPLALARTDVILLWDPEDQTLIAANISRPLTCAPTATRTRDLLLRRQSLYPLSYRGPTVSLPADMTDRSPRGAIRPGRHGLRSARSGTRPRVRSGQGIWMGAPAVRSVENNSEDTGEGRASPGDGGRGSGSGANLSQT